MRSSSGDREKMEPLGTQSDYVSQHSPGGCACVRQGRLEGGRGGKGKEDGWPSELAAAPLSRAVAREGSLGDAAGGCVVEETDSRTPLPCMVATRDGLLPARRSRRGARVQPDAARVLPARVTWGSCGGTPLSVSVAFVSWSRCHVPESAGTRLCQNRGRRG